MVVGLSTFRFKDFIISKARALANKGGTEWEHPSFLSEG
jgi:hypothetical protein